MASYRGSGAVASGNGVTSRTVNDSASFGAGDLLIVEGYISDATGLAATGWNLTTHAASGFDYVVLWKAGANGGGSDDVTVSWTNSGFASLQMHAFQNVNATTPIYNITAGTPVASTSKTAPSVNATYTNDLWVVMGMEDNFGTWSVDTGFTEHIDGGASAGNLVASKALSASGATGTATMTSAGSTDGLVVSMLISDTTPTGGGGATTRRYTLTTLGVG